MIYTPSSNKVINTKAPQVVFENGLRKIKPHYDTRTCAIKGRFFNRTLVDILTSEFRSKTEEEYIKEILDGKYRIYVHYKNAEIIEKQKENSNFTNELSDPQQILTYRFKQNDAYKISYHKHEPFCLQWCDDEVNDFGKNLICGMDILANNDDYIVIDKPGGIIVHPSASYYDNSITNILFHSTGNKLYSTFRLDKVTSGVLALGKSSEGAKKFHENIKNKNCFKYYLAKTKGKFPGTAIGLGKFMDMCNNKNAKGNEEVDFPMETAVIERSPIYQIDTKSDFKHGFSEPKEAESHFQLIAFNESKNESLVLCRPISGRQHQLRIHLMRLNHAIPGDFIYDIEKSYYPKKISFIKEVLDHREQYPDVTVLKDKFDEFRDEFIDLLNDNSDGVPIPCPECGQEEFTEPPVEEMKIFLHSFRYRIVEEDASTPDLCFQTKLPQWAFEFSK